MLLFREELNERMSNTQDGTFLVRDSSDGVKDNYTLALRHVIAVRYLHEFIVKCSIVIMFSDVTM